MYCLICSAGARDGVVNDHYKLFVVCAASMDLNLDQQEVTKADWFDVVETHREWNQQRPGAATDAWPTKGTIAGKPVDVLALEALNNFVEGRCFKMQHVHSNRSKPREMFV